MAAAAMGTWEIVHALRAQALEDAGVAGLPAPEQEARLFGHVLEHLPVGFEPGETLAGDFGWRYAGTEVQEALWNLSHRPTAAPASAAGPMQLLADRFHCFAGYTPAHTCADYQRVVEHGLEGILADVREAQAGADPEQRPILPAMETALDAVIRWAERYAAGARAQASAITDASAREALLRIAAACEWVPRHPARSFHEAIQAIWLVHAAIGLSELSDSSLSLGRLDQYLYPLFCRDLQRGVPLDDLERSLRDLWRKLNRFGDPACAVNLGGADEAGRDLFNPLSALIVRVSKSLRLPAPILAARIHEGLPQNAFDSLVCEELFTQGQPTLYGEVPCRRAITRRGVPAGEAHRFALNSCMGIVMPGEEISDMWGAVANLLLPLELALDGGKPFVGELPITLQTHPCADYPSFKDLYDRFTSYLSEIVAVLMHENRRATLRHGERQPNPFLSALTRDCIARGKDRALGGARYHSVIVEGFGWCNAADALTAIRQLVFVEGRYRLAELVDAARRNFAGADAILRDLLRCPKYGNSDPEADEMARRVTATFAGLVSAHSDGSVGAPSYHTLNAHIGAGGKLSASLDGRRAGEPLGKNVGPMLGRAREGLSAVLLSASALDQEALSGGQALDVSVDPSLLRGLEGRRKLQAAFLAYFARGGLQIQVNGVTAAELREAMAHPDAHQELLVRIAGYSARFVTLGREVQEEMVARFQQGL